MNTLHIDTSDRTRAIVKTKQGKRVCESVSEDAGFRKSQVTLPLIEECLKKASLKLEEIDHIEVEKGPGSFTGLRVGISIANALAFCLQKSVNYKNLGEIEIPVYS